ncbi:Uma2 family endonuclease [Phormidium sp. FACHB-1136]|jgi:Uma2 family endonuclease|uniref:Uma2 family endonuclease n=1 Tax=Phormidium sp. FACHB-1136 TaxID=2692848 RepID=UPI001683DA28|nr:Uma2 family endonuclease [Phormidium sp. FACHB-1136]MBD2429085.1 Uma2 family endonuclease [Phormidium sp. FACHB-1136]
MVQAVSQFMSFQEFLAWKPETGRYELHDGVIVEMQPTGPHEQVVGLLNRKLNALLDQEDLNYFIPNTALVQPLGFETGYKPDVLMVDRAALAHEPLWERKSVVTLGRSVKLVVEVTSTNWPDDYARKFEDYEAMGIAEYWIVDYRGLGGRRYIGTPKQPTITVCQLVEGGYRTQLFRRGEQVVSPGFPNLRLMADQIFVAGD